MRIHPRTKTVNKARGELTEFLCDLEQRHELTIGEVLSLLGEEVMHFARFQVRADRHPHDPDKKADEA